MARRRKIRKRRIRRTHRYWQRVAARVAYPVMARLAMGLALIGAAATLAAAWW